MNGNFEIRYAAHPEDFKSYTTERIRRDFLVQNLFEEDKINIVYSHYDRMIIGGVLPTNESIKLESLPLFETKHFLDRKEMGIINIGGKGTVVADGTAYELNTRDALYLGEGNKEIIFKSDDSEKPAKFYINACAAFKNHRNKLIKKEESKTLRLGTVEECNLRSLVQYIAPDIVPTCQLMMGITTPDPGSSWNTMPAHVHELRMEAYFYFDIPENKAVAHVMGQPDETRIVWVNNEEVVISPPWSIHTGSGTSPYSFVWGMAGDDGICNPINISSMK